ncbi:hypothetical protein NEHOM01_0537 [Nematocida homosporus]|uniref:uncharacterized protein n=1 Tax=Nematocida homosporus TaxID=1912981 RepID=UPI00221F5501|nr:uncharacterized protein NEHOM01_0537 [Nematocida homosporus]KAI5184986.1 hypothetical protein NEHOM01_0537 [Nematocida homosporus]
MRVITARTQTHPLLIGLDEKYLKLASPHFVIDLHDISQIQRQNQKTIITTPEHHLEIEGLSLSDSDQIIEVVQKKRMISQDEIKTLIKQDIQLNHLYQNIATEEQQLFYKTFGDRIISRTKKSDPDLTSLHSSRKKAQYVLTNRTLLNVFFKMNIDFDQFVKDLFTGYVIANQEENEVDKMLLVELKRGSGPVERLNAYSMIEESEWTSWTPTERPQLPLKTRDILNPGLFQNIPKPKPIAISTSPTAPATLTPPQIQVSTLKPITTIPIPTPLLRRMRETSRLVAKTKVSTKTSTSTAMALEQIFREETRRRFSEKDGEVALLAINRILPTRFITKPKPT